MKISTEVEISAAHFLGCVEKGHKCGNIHGHNWRIVVEIMEFDDLKKIHKDMVMDFGIIKKYLRMFDHKFLVDRKYVRPHKFGYEILTPNGAKVVLHEDSLEVLPFEVTAENMACYFAEAIKELCKNRVVCGEFLVRVYETPTNSAEYTAYV